MQVALLITTYNRPDALNAVLESVYGQTRLPNEVIVCDDGSTAATRSLITSWTAKLPVRYAWVSDQQFRASKTRNLGILKSQSELLIFVDGDCLLPPSFIETQIQLARPGYVVAGGRRLLTSKQTESILVGREPLGAAFRSWKFTRYPLGPLRNLKTKDWSTVRTCNLSVHRDDVIKIAGFDEKFIGWGLEDTDFVFRLIRSGIKIRSGRLGVCVAHLHHEENSRDQLSANTTRFAETVASPDHVVAKSSILAE